MFAYFAEKKGLLELIETQKSFIEELKEDVAKKSTEIKNKDKQIESLQGASNTSGKTIIGLDKKIIALELRLQKATKIVREQSEADLLVNALKAVGIIPAPEEYDAMEEERRLRVKQQQLGSLAAGRPSNGQAFPIGDLYEQLFGSSQHSNRMAGAYRKT